MGRDIRVTLSIHLKTLLTDPRAPSATLGLHVSADPCTHARDATRTGKQESGPRLMSVPIWIQRADSIRYRLGPSGKRTSMGTRAQVTVRSHWHWQCCVQHEKEAAPRTPTVLERYHDGMRRNGLTAARGGSQQTAIQPQATVAVVTVVVE